MQGIYNRRHLRELGARRSASCPDEEMLADSFFELAFRSKARLRLLLGFEWPMALTGLCLPWSRGPP